MSPWSMSLQRRRKDGHAVADSSWSLRTVDLFRPEYRCDLSVTLPSSVSSPRFDHDVEPSPRPLLPFTAVLSTASATTLIKVLN